MTRYFTICSKNFVAQAMTLYESLRAQDAEIDFHLILCDTPEGLDAHSLPFPVVGIDELGIPDWDYMREQYNITELNTALKPFAFLLLFERHPGDAVIYLDPDIYVTSRLIEVESALESGSPCVLTPHIAEPAEFAEFDDQKFLQYGAYNLGFCGLRDGEAVRRVVSWWGRKLARRCVIDLPSGLFVDQKWVDLFPSFLDHTLVLRHPGYNVAYWNLSQRRVRRDGTRFLANEQELRFAHLSGVVLGSPTVLSRHSRSFTRQNTGDFALLLDQYEAAVRHNGHAFFSQLPYGFKWSGAKGENLHTPESVRSAVLANGRTGRHLPLTRERSYEEHVSRSRLNATLETTRRSVELELLPSAESAFEVPGVCALCEKEVLFRAGFMYAPEPGVDGRRRPNWREHLDCPECRLVNRVRASLQLFLQELRPSRSAALYLTERVTPTYDWLRARFDNVQGSEFLPGQRSPGEIVNGVRHEDLQSLSFGEATFDFALSFDVLEHVPHEERAFAELARVLKPGGRLLFTAPFSPAHTRNVVRATMDPSGRIEHHLEPEYHGNPVDPEGGALAFRYFGWQVLDQLRDAGFERVEALHYWSRELGYLGPDQYVLTATRKG